MCLPSIQRFNPASMPPETVVAEKLEAIVKLGMANSLMRGYYDLLVILRICAPDSHALAKAIVAAFQQRRTHVPDGAPVGLSDEFARDPTARRRWPEFLNRLQIKGTPEDPGDVVKAIWTRVEVAMIKANALTLGR